MTPERFKALLDSYGSDPRRWPADEREAAAARAAGSDSLAEAAQLDAWLSTHEAPQGDDALVARILADAAALRAAPHATPWWRQARWLWPGAGLAGAGLAGSLAGAVLVSVALPDPMPLAGDAPERGSAFTELYSDWSHE